jgi:hypothetical protein
MEVTSPMSPTSPTGFGFGPTTIKVLFAIYPGVNGSDVLGPLEVLTKALHNISDPSMSLLSLMYPDYSYHTCNPTRLTLGFLC